MVGDYIEECVSNFYLSDGELIPQKMVFLTQAFITSGMPQNVSRYIIDYTPPQKGKCNKLAGQLMQVKLKIPVYCSSPGRLKMLIFFSVS